MVSACGVHYYSAGASDRQKGLKIRFYFFCQKEAIIRKARELNKIIFQGNKIQIYHRISVSTLETRQELKKIANSERWRGLLLWLPQQALFCILWTTLQYEGLEKQRNCGGRILKIFFLVV